jgi:hypothetical protein
MAYASRTYTSGSGTTFALTTSGGSPIGYIKESDIAVKVNGTTYTNAASGANTYQISGTSTVEQPSGGNVVLNASVSGATVVLSRTTAIQDATVVYTAGSTLTSTDLNNADNQIRFGLQEFSDTYDGFITGTGDLSTLGGVLGGADSWVSSNAYLATTSAVDGQIDVKTTAKVKDDIIATAPVSIADDSPSAGKITISVDAELTELATMSTGTAQALADLTGTEVQILDGATLTTTELNYVDGVTSAVQTQIDGKQAADAQLTELATMGSTTAEALADLTQAEVQILDGATATTAELNILDGVTSTTAELNILDGVTSTAAELNILDGVTATTAEINYVDGVTSNVQTQVDAKQPLDADLTTLAGMQGATASILAGTPALTSTLTEINQLDGITLADTSSLDTTSNTKVPTSKAVADHVSGAVTAVGGFIAIANDASFPATASIPASGVVVSISDAGGVVVQDGTGGTTAGRSTTGRTTDGTPATVTINNFPNSLYNETLVAGVGLQVTSTGSSNTYNYHKLLAKEGDVKELSDDINDFNARYRTGNSDPGSDNDEGDLFFNKTSNTMKVYDGSNWGEVTSTGDFKFLFLCPKSGGSGAPTFDGSEKEFDLRETSNSGTGASVTNAAQLMISVNGVVQKPNAGTNESGLDGFVLADANTIKFCAAPVSGDEVFVIQSGSAVTLNAPANNTVSTDVLQNLAVTNGKIADDTIAEGKLDIHQAPSDGKFLKYTSSNGMEWGDVPAGIGGAVGADFNDDVKLRFGTGNDMEIYTASNNAGTLKSSSGIGLTTTGASTQATLNSWNTSGTPAAQLAVAANSGANTSAGLYYNAGQKLITTNTGITVTGTVAATAYTGDGSALTGIASTSLDGCGYENAQTISAGTYEIAVNKGMHSVGPITNNGTVTVNGRWVIS